MNIEKLFIDSSLSIDQEIEKILLKTGLVPEIVSDQRMVFDFVNSFPDPVAQGKKTLYITHNRGALIKKCPGTTHYTCCDYTILHLGTFCTMDCSYCILQAYFHPPVLQYFAGRKRILEALEPLFEQDKIFRVGTGEFTDSLIWEKISDLPEFLIKTFATQKSSVLELKTKTVNIEGFKSLDHRQKTIISWSLNTPGVIQSEEKRTASLSARLAAAARCESWGYPLGFHFDPLVIYDGCEKEYCTVIHQLFDTIAPESVTWISLGTFRFMPALKPLIEKRFPSSVIPYGEFILGLDNKMRYFKPLRIKLYQSIVTCIRERAPDVLIYFCMEDRDVWERCLGFYPDKEGALGRMLDLSAAHHCSLDKMLI